MSGIEREKASAVNHEWQTQALASADNTNAQLEGDDANTNTTTALPAGQAFASTNSTGNISGTMNGQTQNTSPLWQQITGALIGGAGLLGGVGAFGKNGWLNFGKD
jgi:hypothetical protein